MMSLPGYGFGRWATFGPGLAGYGFGKWQAFLVSIRRISHVLAEPRQSFVRWER